MGRKLPKIEVTFIHSFSPEEPVRSINRAYDILFAEMMADGYVFSQNGLLVKPPVEK